MISVAQLRKENCPYLPPPPPISEVIAQPTENPSLQQTLPIGCSHQCHQRYSKVSVS